MLRSLAMVGSGNFTNRLRGTFCTTRPREKAHGKIKKRMVGFVTSTAQVPDIISTIERRDKHSGRRRREELAVPRYSSDMDSGFLLLMCYTPLSRNIKFNV